MFATPIAMTPALWAELARVSSVEKVRQLSLFLDPSLQSPGLGITLVRC